ncbi:hypothetical protein RB597_009786 [Gaeumannomyces tritici]
METVAAIFGYAQPTKKQQLSKCRLMTDREVRRLKQEISSCDRKKRNVITWKKNAEKRVAIPARRAQAQREIRSHESSLAEIDNQVKRLETTIVMLGSVKNSIATAEANLIAEKSLRTAGKVTGEVNKLGRADLIRLQQSMGTYVEELMRSEVMNEIYDETLPGGMEEDIDPVMDTEVQATLDGILGPGILGSESSANDVLSTLPVPQKSMVKTLQEENTPQEEDAQQEEDERSQALLGELNQKLEFLRS